MIDFGGICGVLGLGCMLTLPEPTEPGTLPHDASEPLIGQPQVARAPCKVLEK
jgi:hypothetical protein